MPVITFLSFRSTRFILDLSFLTGKGNQSPILLFPFKDSFCFNVLAAIYDKKYYEKYVRSQMYHIVKDVTSLIITLSKNHSFANGPHIFKQEGSTQLNPAD